MNQFWLTTERRTQRVKNKLGLAAFRVTGWPPHPGFCPVCESPVSVWQPLIRQVGEDEYEKEDEGRLCPTCGSMERTRHFWLWLQANSVLKSSPRFLHFAPELGLERRLRAILGKRYITTDLFMPNVDMKMSITDIKLDDGSIDFIYCSNVLEHVPEDRKAMAELRRILAPGGKMIFQVPIGGEKTYEDPAIQSPEDRTKHFGQADHVRFYGRDVRTRLEEAGLAVEELIMLDALKLTPEKVLQMNLDKRELVHLCGRGRG